MDKQEIWTWPLRVRSRNSRRAQMPLGKLVVILATFGAMAPPTYRFGFGSVPLPQARGQTPPSNPNPRREPHPLAPTGSPSLPPKSESVSETGGKKSLNNILTSGSSGKIPSERLRRQSAGVRVLLDGRKILDVARLPPKTGL